MATICTLVLSIIQCVPRACNSEECLRAAQMMISNRNTNQDRCIDFYEYACGNFIVTHPLTGAVTSRFMVDDQLNFLNQKIAEALNVQDPSALHAVRRAREAYRQCIAQSHVSAAQELCIGQMKQQFPRVLLYLLATREVYATRGKIMKMADYLKRSYMQIIEKPNWIDDQTKMAIKEKISRVRIMAAFGDNTINEANLEAPLESKINLFGISSGYAHEPHVIFVPITVFFYPTYQLGLEALNYAGVGFQIAHEMSHIMDDKGRRTIQGWTQIMETIFIRKGLCFTDQYNQFPVPNIPGTLGMLTSEENIQDNVGFQIVLGGYRLYAKENRREKKLARFEDYSHDKLFMLALANTWCENLHPNYVRKLVTHEGYPPAVYRINGMIMNSKDFGELWNCPETSPMNPHHKCSIWSNVN